MALNQISQTISKDLNEIFERISVLDIKDGSNPLDKRDQRPAGNAEVIQDLLAFSGEKMLEKIMEHDNPQLLVRTLPQEDFYWIVKKAGEDECLPLLQMASDDQKQYLLDLEFWEKDRLNLEKTSVWFARLLQADPEGFARWLFTKGEAVAYYYLFKKIHVEIKSEDDDHHDFGDRFFTLDGLFYVSVPDDVNKESIVNTLRAMASEDLGTYQTLLANLAGVIPAELEEDMYRLKGVRLAEHGFLPLEEALEVYAPLAPDAVNTGDKAKEEHSIPEDDVREIIPISPFYHARGQNLLNKAFSEINDNLALDRLRLEFAGLCNQILSADGVIINDLDILISACQKAAGHLNVILEKLCDDDIRKAEALLRSNPLVSLFRAGFGLVLRIKWEADRWVKNSWFSRQGLGLSFWPEKWAENLKGILKDKPLHHAGAEEIDTFRGFEHLSELENCQNLIHRLIVLDRLMEHLSGLYPFDLNPIEDPQLTFYQMLFNLWSRKSLDLELSFSSISRAQTKAFFEHLRDGEETPPFQMPGFEDVFISDFMGFVSDLEPEQKADLRAVLSLIWREFAEEYESVTETDIEGRFSKYLEIE